MVVANLDPAVAAATLAVELVKARRATKLPDRYQFDPAGYIRDQLGWEPWHGTPDEPGQIEVLDAYRLALQQQTERLAYEAGTISADQLVTWHPDEPIKNRLILETGHGIGKTKVASGIVNHFFDCFVPSIIYTFAPGWEQIHDLLWKEIKADRRGANLPGRILDLALDRGDDHFAKGRATNNNRGTGTERVQGQHGRYLMFVLDEAEGIDDYVWDAIDSMASGGLVIVLMLGNPRTRTSRFHKARERADAVRFQIPSIAHPNVRADRDVIPGAVRRAYVEQMLEDHCELVPEHAEDDHTFEVPWRPGVIYRPDPEMLFRVLGIAPANIADNTFVPVGRYEAACKRDPLLEDATRARFGVDVARYGSDLGTLYVRHAGRVRRVAQFSQQDSFTYARAIKAEALRLKGQGVADVAVRVDGGGGFGSGVIDVLRHDADLAHAFAAFEVLEVHFGGTPHDATAYADLATEMYGEAAESLKGLRIDDPPPLLEGDLCERPYEWVNKAGVDVKRLRSKELFRKAVKRSPDDGDGFVLAVAPDYLFGLALGHLEIGSVERSSPWTTGQWSGV